MYFALKPCIKKAVSHNECRFFLGLLGSRVERLCKLLAKSSHDEKPALFCRSRPFAAVHSGRRAAMQHPRNGSSVFGATCQIVVMRAMLILPGRAANAKNGAS